MDQPQYKPYFGSWFILTAPFNFCFTLRELFRKYETLLDEYVSKVGIMPDECIYLCVPSGLVTDLASIPKVFEKIGITSDGPWGPAAILHDLLYQRLPNCKNYADTPFGALSEHYDKQFADMMFHLAMLRYGVDPVVAEAMFRAVLGFGESSFTDPNTELKYPIPGAYKHYAVAPFQFFHDSSLEERDDAARGVLYYPNIKRAFINAVL